MARSIKQQTSYLPLEIIGEILARLPAKTVSRFKIVSKSWLSLITSKSFIKTHLQHAPRNTQVLMVKRIGNPKLKLWQRSLISFFDDPDPDAAKLINIPTHKYVKSIHIVGCCNGLICLILNEEHYMLWNPCTRVSKQLPPITTRTAKGIYAWYGFGYNESSDDYKVLCFGVFDKDENIGLYSLKTDSWNIMVSDLHRVLHRVHFGVFFNRGKFVSGKLHWASHDNCNIVAFDLKKEAYEMFEQPGYIMGAARPYLLLCPYLGQFRDRLSLQYIHQSLVEVWVMNEYGMKESWEKVIAIDLLYLPLHYYKQFSPFWIDHGEKVVLLQNRYILFYNRKRDYPKHDYNFFFDHPKCDSSGYKPKLGSRFKPKRGARYKPKHDIDESKSDGSSYDEPKRDGSNYKVVKMVVNQLWDEMHIYSESLISLSD